MGRHEVESGEEAGGTSQGSSIEGHDKFEFYEVGLEKRGGSQGSLSCQTEKCPFQASRKS